MGGDGDADILSVQVLQVCSVESTCRDDCGEFSGIRDVHAVKSCAVSADASP